MLSIGRRAGCEAKGQVRGGGMWRLLPDGLYFSVELNSCFLCVLFCWFFVFVFVLLFVLAESNKDLEHILSGIAKGLEHRLCWVSV